MDDVSTTSQTRSHPSQLPLKLVLVGFRELQGLVWVGVGNLDQRASGFGSLTVVTVAFTFEAALRELRALGAEVVADGGLLGQHSQGPG